MGFLIYHAVAVNYLSTVRYVELTLRGLLNSSITQKVCWHQAQTGILSLSQKTSPDGIFRKINKTFMYP